MTFKDCFLLIYDFGTIKYVRSWENLESTLQKMMSNFHMEFASDVAADTGQETALVSNVDSMLFKLWKKNATPLSQELSIIKKELGQEEQ